MRWMRENRRLKAKVHTAQMPFNTSVARATVPARRSGPKGLDVASECAPERILRCLSAATLFPTPAKQGAQKGELTQKTSTTTTHVYDALASYGVRGSVCTKAVTRDCRHDPRTSGRPPPV